jgi:ubiquinone/menaquinone biosynthesis C-methylase UbiE
MKLGKLRRDWDELGRTDPLWAILTLPEKQGGRWDLTEFFNSGRYEISRVAEHVESLGLALGSGRALDFGCGVGRLSQALAERFDEVVGVDIAASMIEQANELNRHGERVTYVLNTTDDLRILGDRPFDLVYSNITLQHMPPRYMRRYLAEFLRVLGPGGHVVFELTTRPGFRMRWLCRLARLRRRRYKMFVYWMRPETVAAVVKRHGGAVLDAAPTIEKDGWLRYRYCIARAGDAPVPREPR